MKETVYTYKDLILLYIATNIEPDKYAHIDFYNFKKNLLTNLETAFGVKLSATKTNNPALFMLFHATVRSFNSIRTPWSSFLEASLIIKKLEESGELGKKVLELTENIDELASSSMKAHEEMIDTLFEAIFGIIDKTVSSEDLKNLGFDDSTHPKPEDYEDGIEFEGFT